MGHRNGSGALAAAGALRGPPLMLPRISAAWLPVPGSTQHQTPLRVPGSTPHQPPRQQCWQQLQEAPGRRDAPASRHSMASAVSPNLHPQPSHGRAVCACRAQPCCPAAALVAAVLGSSGPCPGCLAAQLCSSGPLAAAFHRVCCCWCRPPPCCSTLPPAPALPCPPHCSCRACAARSNASCACRRTTCCCACPALHCAFHPPAVHASCACRRRMLCLSSTVLSTHRASLLRPAFHGGVCRCPCCPPPPACSLPPLPPPWVQGSEAAPATGGSGCRCRCAWPPTAGWTPGGSISRCTGPTARPRGRPRWAMTWGSCSALSRCVAWIRSAPLDPVRTWECCSAQGDGLASCRGQGCIHATFGCVP